MKNKGLAFGISTIIIVAIYFIGSSLYKESVKEDLSFLAQESSEIFMRDYSPRYGEKSAKVFLTEFLDPECESCRKLYPNIKALLKEYKGKVQLVVRYAPFHGNSMTAIKALEAARIQGKYWESLSKLFHYQPLWGDHHHPKIELIYSYLEELGLDMAKLRTDMSSEEIARRIRQDQDDLKTLGVRATPTFFVNGKPLQKFGYSYLRDLIESEVKLQYSND